MNYLVLSLYLLLIVFASWRLASLLVDEKGPFSLFKRLRGWAEAKAEVEKLSSLMVELSSLLDCVKCISVWIAPLLTLHFSWMLAGALNAQNFLGIAVVWVISSLAVSTMVIAWHRMNGVLKEGWALLEHKAAYYEAMLDAQEEVFEEIEG